MILIEKADVTGWEAAVRGMRNPMNSWGKSDSKWQYGTGDFNDELTYYVGEKDIALMKQLAVAGSDHRKVLRFITVTADITAPLYWWKEYDTYKVGTVANSCSTMHKIQAKEFTMDDFSHEHLIDYDLPDGTKIGWRTVMETLISTLNTARDLFLANKDKTYWWQMIQLLPSSYNQKRTVLLNYEVLRNMYHARKNHKLDEWHDFCAWVEGLPFGHLITVKEDAG